MEDMNGGNYVPAPENPNYSNDPVMARATPADITIPSSATVVYGVYFAWNENGFLGKSWLFDYKNISHPLRDNTYRQLRSTEEVNQWFKEGNDNFDALFSAWSAGYYDYLDFANLFNEGAVCENCAVFNN
ncbi:MAG: hypothetical protein ACLU6W_12210 [Lachnospiraceae bacterium]